MHNYSLLFRSRIRKLTGPFSPRALFTLGSSNSVLYLFFALLLFLRLNKCLVLGCFVHFFANFNKIDMHRLNTVHLDDENDNTYDNNDDEK